MSSGAERGFARFARPSARDFVASNACVVERSPDARAFNAPLYLLSYLGKLIWRPVRDSNPRLPTRQAGTLATELTKRCCIGGGDRLARALRSAFGPLLRNVLIGFAAQSERAACRLQGGCSAC